MSTRLTLLYPSRYGPNYPDYERQILVPEGFSGEPTSTLDVLRRTLASLLEEECWMQNSWFQNEHPEVDSEDAFCNNWAACMEGHVYAVSFGAIRGENGGSWSIHPGVLGELGVDGDEAHARRYHRALDYLLAAARNVFPVPTDEDGVEIREPNVPTWNDCVCTSRTRACDWVREAIRLAEEDGPADASD